MKLYKGWKVTDYEGCSCVVSVRHGSVQYIKGEWTKPIIGNGPLAVFTNLINALEFNEDMDALHKCLYEKSEYTDMWYMSLDGGTKAASNIVRGYPSGTDLASRVMIVD